MTFSKTLFQILTSEMESASIKLVTLAIFAIFHPQTTEIQLYKVECFVTNTLQFQHDDVIIYDISRDFEFSLK